MLFRSAGIANARMNKPIEVWDHPQLKARKRWRKVTTPKGEIDALLPPVNLGGHEARMDAVPAVGEHTDRILAELGYSAAHIEQLHAAKAV